MTSWIASRNQENKFTPLFSAPACCTCCSSAPTVAALHPGLPWGSLWLLLGSLWPSLASLLVHFGFTLELLLTFSAFAETLPYFVTLSSTIPGTTTSRRTLCHLLPYILSYPQYLRHASGGNTRQHPPIWRVNPPMPIVDTVSTRETPNMRPTYDTKIM